MRRLLLLLLLLTAALPALAQTRSAGPPQSLPAGFVSLVTDPTLSGNPNELFDARLGCTFTMAQSTPGIFGDQNCLEIAETAIQGQNSYGGLTNGKATYLPLLLTGSYYAAGQRFGHGEIVNCFGMGDCFGESRTVDFAGADIQGDEGQGFGAVSTVSQQNFLVKTTVTAIRRATLATTLTQSVTAARTPQTVTVASSAGAAVGDWLEIDQEAASHTPNHEAVQVTAVGAGTITAIFRNNHNAGAPVTPALVLTLANAGNFGQGRVLVDLTASPYTTGTIASIPGGGNIANGSGTSWSAGMVGDAAPSPGCIAFAADEFTAGPFGAGASALESWYQIVNVASATQLTFYKTSVAGDAAYRGLATGGAYTIRPCAEVLYLPGTTAPGSNSQIVLASSAAPWNVGDTVELAIAPYPDVTGFQYQIGAWTPGGTYRAFEFITNVGARQFGAAIDIRSAMAAGSNADANAWSTGVLVEAGAVTGFEVDNPAGTGLIVNHPASGQNGIAVDMGTGNGGIGLYLTGTGNFTGVQAGGGIYGAHLSGRDADVEISNGTIENANVPGPVSLQDGTHNPYLTFSTAANAAILQNNRGAGWEFEDSGGADLLDYNVTTAATWTFPGAVGVNVAATTAATSTTTGALKVGGGAGIAGSIYVGGSLNGNASPATVIAAAGTTSESLSKYYGELLSASALGFVGDGITDNTAAIGNLFALTGSQRVFLPPGTYVLSACPSQWIAASAISLFGAGQSATTIRFPLSCTIGSTGGVFAWTGRAGVAVRNLTIDLNNAVASPVGATPILQFNGTNNVVVDHVSIINGSDHELLVSLVAGATGINGYTITNNYLALSAGAAGDNQCINASDAGGTITKGVIEGNICINSGMFLTGSWSSVTNNDVSGSRFGSNIAVGPSATTDHWTIANNRAHDSGTGQDSNSDCQAGFEIWAAHATITGNIAYNNGSDGIMFGGPHDSVVGNIAWNNGAAGLNNAGCGQNGFHANYSSASINAGGSIVSGNQAWDDGSGTQKYGYADVANLTAPVTFGPNDFTGATAATNILAASFGTAWSTAAYGRGAGADPVAITTAFGAKDDFWAQVPATTGKTGFYALQDDYGTSFAATFLIQHGSADTGTTDGINNANLGVLNFQNNTGLIRNNGASPIKVAIAGTVRTTTFNGFQIGLPTGGDEGTGTLNVQNAYYANGVAGVTCSGAPTASFAAANGIVTHC